MAPRVICVSQARMTSTRLPGKVLLPILDKPMIGWHLTRLQRCRNIDELVLATTTNATDDPLAEYAASLGVRVARGSEHDVLDRFVQAVADAPEDSEIVRVTGDCPLIDPALVDALIALRDDQEVDYASVDVARFPRGLDAEVFPRRLLMEAGARASTAHEREHVTPYLYATPGRFSACHLEAPVDLSKHRWCVDEPADFELVRRLIENLAPKRPEFGWQDCVELLNRHPDWALLNRAVAQRAGHAELEEA